MMNTKKKYGSYARQVWSDLSITDKLLPIFIILAMILGILLSVYVPSSRRAFDGAQVEGVSIPLAIGLIIMMIPPLCKVEWENFFNFFGLKRYLDLILVSLVLNWILCPFLMFGLAWMTLFDEDEYRIGIIMIGMARCIAMVLVWNDISDGDSTLCAVIVLVNSMLQIVLYAPYQIFFCYVITGDYGSSMNVGVSYTVVARSVAFFLGIPLAAGLVIRMFGRYCVGLDTYNSKIMPFIGPWALIGLLYTIIVIFIEKGHDFITHIGSALRCFVPLVLYFFITWFGVFFFMRWYYSFSFKKKISYTDENIEEKRLLCGCDMESEENKNKSTLYCSASYKDVVTQTFTAASNNFELSLAVAISLYGSGSKQSIAATFGPLLEVPILLMLCFVAKFFKLKFLWRDENTTLPKRACR